MADARKLDPTKTTTIRRQFMAETASRFRWLWLQIQKLVIDDDAFGLTVNVVNQERQAWRFQTDEAKIRSFRQWFTRQVNAGVLIVDTLGKPWTAKYVSHAYRRGLANAWDRVRGRRRRRRGPSLVEIPPDRLGAIARSREEFLRLAFSQFERTGKAQLLYTRTYEELQGITEDMASRMSRVLADGMIRGDGPRPIARRLRNEINTLTRTRALTLARTETIYAHAEGTLDAFEELGIDDIVVEAEWLTVGDNRVCARCAALEGVVLTVQEARGLLPRHPNCRCTWTPAVRSNRERRNKAREKARKLRAIRKSVQAERPNFSFDRARAASSWLGKELLEI